MTNLKRLLPLLCFLMFAGLSGAAGGAGSDGRSFNLRDVDIRAFVEQISSITGESFVVDPQIKGKVTVIAGAPLSTDEVNELFLAVMRVNGYAAVPSGNITRIVPQAAAKTGWNDGSNQQFITRVVSLKNANVEEAVKMMRPLASQNGYMEGSVFSNALIISDYADNVRQIAQALAQLDKGNDGEVEVIPLQEGWVGDIAPLIEALAPVQLAEGGGKSRNRLRVVADERSNSIIIKGDKAQRDQIRALVEKLDQKNPNGSDIQLIRLQFADARQVAALLRGVALKENKARPAAGYTAPLPPNTNSAVLSGLFNAPPEGQQAQPAPDGEGEDIATAQSFIQADAALNALIVKAEPGVMSEIRNLVKQLDIRRPQVLIEAAIVEITSAQGEQLGVQLAGGDLARGIHTGSTQFSAPNAINLTSLLTRLNSANAAAFTGQGAALALGVNDKFDVLIQALASTSGANLLSTPSITTLDNEEAKIVVGQNVPFRTGSFSTLNAGVTNPFTTIERQDVGITLKVRPQIHLGNLVRLKIDQEVSSVVDAATSPVAGAADLVTNKRTLETKVLAQDGETIVLGGLMQDDTTQAVDKVPLLGDIPIIGAAFSSKRQANAKRNLLVFLRPTVLDAPDAVAKATQTRYDRVRELNMFGGGNGVAATNVNPATLFDPPAKQLPWLLD